MVYQARSQCLVASLVSLLLNMETKSFAWIDWPVSYEKSNERPEITDLFQFQNAGLHAYIASTSLAYPILDGLI